MHLQPEEFRRLALAEMDAVYRLASHLAHDRDEADDLAQETFLRGFRSAATFHPTEHGMRPWLFKILHNVINTRLSKEQRQRAVAEDVAHETAPSGAAGEPPLDPAMLNWEDIDQRIKLAIGDLSLSHRTTFLLCAVEGLNYREIAEVTDVPVGTVMSRLYRARAALSRRLAGLAAERGLGGLGAGKPRENDEMERPS